MCDGGQKKAETRKSNKSKHKNRNGKKRDYAFEANDRKGWQINRQGALQHRLGEGPAKKKRNTNQIGANRV